MNKRIIDLSGIKDDDLDETSSFTDLMTKKQKKERSKEISNEIDYKKVTNKEDDLEEMLEEKKKNTNDLTQELEKVQKEYKSIYKDELKNNVPEENLGKTQLLDLTRAMKFNFEETKNKNTKKIISPLNIIGEVNLLCIGYYIYLLVFTSYQEKQENYLITGGIIILLVLLFGLSVVTSKKASKLFNILNILAIVGFVVFNAYTLIY